MSRYIDADKLINELKFDFVCSKTCCSQIAKGIEELKYQFAIDAINDAPTADVVEVVRCKDCKCWDSDLKECDRESRVSLSPAAYAVNFEADDWCSYGERKEDE